MRLTSNTEVIVRALLFDTETTGLWNFKLPHGHSAQPEIVQLAILMIEKQEDDWVERCAVNLLLKPVKDSEEKALETHGKTKEMLEKFGVPRRLALSMFHHMVANSDLLVAHNLDFDLKMILNAYHLEGIEPKNIPKGFCTMQATTDLCKLPGKRAGSYKWPKLIEAYKILVDPEGFDGAHDALADVRACATLFKKIYRN